MTFSQRLMDNPLDYESSVESRLLAMGFVTPLTLELFS
jgi:hypothetical protein